MNGKIIIGLIVAAVAGTGALVASRNEAVPPQAAVSSPTPSSVPSPATTPTPNAAPPKAVADAQPPSEAKTPGQYLDYSGDALSRATGQRVLFFHAPWCSQCRSIEKGIKSDGVPEGISIVKVDYDSNRELRQKYGIRLQTSFLKVDAQGNALGQPFVAYEEPTFDAVKRNFLASN